MHLETIARLLFLMISAHFLADFTLQTGIIAKFKNPHASSTELFGPGNPAPTIWPWILSAHAFQHGALVFLITQSLGLGLAETAAHWLTDFGKCQGWYGYHADQWIHLGTKVLWVALVAKGLT